MKITVDGCEYTVETRYDGDIIEVLDVNGNKVADAERDSGVECLYFDYYNDEGSMSEFSESSSELYRSSVEEIATWLVSTHPCN